MDTEDNNVSKNVIGALILASLLVTPSKTFAQNSSENRELLTEIRRLSQIVEQSLATSLRLQLVLGKLQIQDHRAGLATARLDEARNKLSDIAAQIAALDDRLERYQQGIDAMRDPKQRETLAALVREGQTQRARLENDRLAAQGDVTEAESHVATEQATLVDLGRQLDSIERMLVSSSRQDK